MTTQPSLYSRNIILSYSTTDPDTQFEVRKVIVTSQEDASRFLSDTQRHTSTDSDWRELRIERYAGLSNESLEAIRWIRDLQDLITTTESKIIDGELTSIEDALETITTHTIFSGIRTLQNLGYCEPDYDLSVK